MYRLTEDPDVVVRLPEGCIIPRDHRWWAEYEAWLSEGNEPEPAPSLRAIEARARRDSLLRGSDWTQLDDAPLPPAGKQAWAVYRAALRALPALPGFPDVEWPEAPDMASGAADLGEVETSSMVNLEPQR